MFSQAARLASSSGVLASCSHRRATAASSNRQPSYVGNIDLYVARRTTHFQLTFDLTVLASSGSGKPALSLYEQVLMVPVAFCNRHLNVVMDQNPLDQLL